MLQQDLATLGIRVSHQTGREIVCYCPLHEDKHPSFSMNVDSEAFHCFNGCLKGRGLHQLKFQLNKSNAIIHSATEEVPPIPFVRTLRYPQKPLPYIPELPLAIGNMGEVFLQARKFNKETIKNWNIQYWEEEKSIVIPFKGIGFILRFLQPNSYRQKYKYVLGTKITASLFGYDKLKYIDNTWSVTLVEGSLDCIWLHQNGYTNGLAVLHSDISRDQLDLLKDCARVYIMMDADEGGDKAKNKIATKLLNRGLDIWTCSLPKGKDPNDLDKLDLENVFNMSQRLKLPLV